MKRTEFAKKLNELRGPTSRAAATMLVVELRDQASRVDAALRADFFSVLQKRGLPIPTFKEAELGPGETWLLLYDASSAAGCAARLVARFDSKGGAPELLSEVRRAHRALLATTARVCRELGRPTPLTIEIDAPYGHFEIEGGSLGLSVAIATLSAVLGRPPATNVAGTAQVDDEGRLRRVEHLAHKLDALHRSWPEVTSVVVALGQALPEGYHSPVRLIPVESLADAIPIFELGFDALGAARLDHYCVRIASFRTDNNQPHSIADWRRLSALAWETSAALAADEPEKSAEAALWAALFSVHSGDPGAANALLPNVPESTTLAYPELLARKLIASASNNIDEGNFREAIARAEHAAKLCEETLHARDRRDLLGQSLGTKGRALMHLGSYDVAEQFLRRALEHHRGELKAEAPRSACYLATCIRLAGRPEEALLLVEDALAAVNAAERNWVVASTTRLFLRLERGRIYAALTRWEDALADFTFVRGEQVTDTDYPRLAAVRGLAKTLRALGRPSEADDALEVCVAIARQVSTPPTLQRVAAIAAGERLLGAEPSRVARAELQAVWCAAFPAETSPASIDARVRAWIY